MDDPVAEIPKVIHLLTQSPPHLQAATIERFFTPSAAFTHPFCRTSSYDLTEYFRNGRLEHSLAMVGMKGALNEVCSSKGLIGGIYRWYKILSPKIDLEVDSVAYDEKNMTLYVGIHQLFKIPYIPFYSAPVKLVTVLNLVPRPSTEHNDSGEPSKTTYLIASQNDLYQTNEFMKFFDPLGVLCIGLLVWQFLATAMSVVGQAALRPIVWWEEGNIGTHAERRVEDVTDQKED